VQSTFEVIQIRRIQQFGILQRSGHNIVVGVFFEAPKAFQNTTEVREPSVGCERLRTLKLLCWRFDYL